MKQLTGQALREFVASHVTYPEGVEPQPIKDTSISLDVCLGDSAWVEIRPEPGGYRRPVVISKGTPTSLGFTPVDLTLNDLMMGPGAFAKALTEEFFNIPPNYKGVFTLRSYGAQLGANQSVSITLHPDWSGFLVMELINNLEHSAIEIHKGEPLGQIEFYEL